MGLHCILGKDSDDLSLFFFFVEAFQTDKGGNV